MIVILATNLDDLGEELIAILRAFRLVHVDHQLLYNLHQILLGYLHAQTNKQNNMGAKGIMVPWNHDCPPSINLYGVSKKLKAECRDEFLYLTLKDGTIVLRDYYSYHIGSNIAGDKIKNTLVQL